MSATQHPTQEALEVATDSKTRLIRLQNKLIDKMLTGMMQLGILAVFLNFWRMQTTGWLPAYTIHTGLEFLVIFALLRRQSLSIISKKIIIFIIFGLVGVSELSTLGLAATATYWLLAGAFVGALILPRRISIIIMVSNIGMVFLAAVGFVSGYLTLAVDLNAYSVHPSGWTAMILGSSWVMFMVVVAVSEFRSEFTRLLYETEQQRDRIRHLAMHDQLTGLPTYRLAADRLDIAIAKAKRHGLKAAVLFIDLDGFKQANDQYGHAAGDQVLIEVANRLTQSVRELDTAARQGGDEFIIVLNELRIQNDAERVAEKLIRAITQPISYEGHAIKVGASIGIALYPDHGLTSTDLLKLADAAMYTVKRSGKNHFALFNTHPPQEKLA